jgi:hypothetical protein
MYLGKSSLHMLRQNTSGTHKKETKYYLNSSPVLKNSHCNLKRVPFLNLSTIMYFLSAKINVEMVGMIYTKGTPIFVQIRQLLYSTIIVPICMLAPHKYKNVSTGILATFFVFLFHLEGQEK